MADLSKLAMKHAHWARVRRLAESMGSEASSRCEVNGLMSTNCIERVYNDVARNNRDFPDDGGYTFDELWADEVASGGVCDACIEVRRLKRVRAHAGRRLGQIRAAFTKAGDHLLAKRAPSDVIESDCSRVVDRLCKDLD